MTRKLYDLALRSASESLVLWGAIEGPYGGHHTLDSYGIVILFAAGVGITHQLTFVRHLLTGYNNNTSAAQNVLLVWCISHVEVLAWIEPWLDEMSAMQNFYEVVCIRVYISRMDPQHIPMRSVPTCFDIRAQRCDPQVVLDEELVAQVGAMAVSVCGQGDFSESVRAAVRRRVCTRSIDLFVETFSY
jgi:ferredoxin-NADP reductase